MSRSRRFFAAALLVIPAALQPTTAAGREPCSRGEADRLVRTFTRAYNRGDVQVLERLWAHEPDFKWYFVQDERVGADAENRMTLPAYFAHRHTLGDRIDLRKVAVGRPSPSGHYGISFKLKRFSDQPESRGMWHGKASVTEAAAGLEVASTNSCALTVWSMGKHD
jgi:hypothetical protein